MLKFFFSAQDNNLCDKLVFIYIQNFPEDADAALNFCTIIISCKGM